MSEHVLATMNESVSYEYSSNHKALDLIPSDGGETDIIAFYEGTVEVAVSNEKYTNHNSTGNATYGNYVIIKHPNGYKTLYAHLKYGSVSVKVGNYVSKGQRIATIGQTGNAYGVHLHFEIRGPDNVRVNPNDYLWKENNVFISNDNIDNSLNNEDEVSDTANASDDSVLTVNEDEVQNGDEDKIVDEEEKVNSDTKETLKNENVNLNNDDYLKNTSYVGGSIVDGLKSLSEDSSFDHRAVLAWANGIDEYVGSFEQNVLLLKLLKSGELINA